MDTSQLPTILAEHQAAILTEWSQAQRNAFGAAVTADQDAQSRAFIGALEQGTRSGQFENILSAAWAPARDVLEDLSRARAISGSSATATATFVFSFKEPIFGRLRAAFGNDAVGLAREVWTTTLLLDKLGLYTAEVFQKSREDVIRRQQEELLELSTPVVQLWQGILAVPLIGTLDSMRTQSVMESLLQEIVDRDAKVAIIDITGVPTVDTLVAQHLLKTVAAARLMGAECIISGIRPQIAQTLVHLGVDLNVISRASLAGALEVALRRIDKVITERTKH